jgi:hypothetical protein
MRALAGDLPADAAAIQRAKRFEFYSLGLVLGYSYACSPVVQPGTTTGATSTGPAADTTTYVPATAPGARLPHAWLPDGTSLYDRLGRAFTLLRPAHRAVSLAGPLEQLARARGIPLTVAQAPPGYPGRDDFLLIRPDQHIAWRAADPRDIDLDLVTGRSLAPARRR